MAEEMSTQEAQEERFVHLHLHSEYSLLDGAIRLRDLPGRLKELGMHSCALTDHGVMYGMVDFFQIMQREGLKPIIGCEIYIAPYGMLVKEGPEARKMHHLILLCENQAGLKNLNQIVSESFVHGFYYKPRVDKEFLAKHAEGLIALSACLGGEIPAAILERNRAKAKSLVEEYQGIFGKENFFLEVQSNGIREQDEVNEVLRELSAETGAPLVATNDCHYLMPEDWKAHDVLLCLQTGRKVDDRDRMRMDSDQFYLKSPEEMIEAFKDFPGACENTVKIAERCHAAFDFDVLYLPKYEPPAPFKDAVSYLRHLTEEGLRERFRALEIPEEKHPEYLERMERELDVIIGMGYVDYYLIVWDFINFARSQEIMVGPGRGSGAASIVAWSLKITNIDPIQYNLLFERFLNPDRVSLPDFDIDFCFERRPEVIDYVTRKYGDDHVCQVITFGTLAARMAVRDVARALDLPLGAADRLAKLIPATLGITLDRALEESAELREVYENDELSHRVLDMARKVEGMPRHASTHAAGVIISSVPLHDVAPLARNDDQIVVQYGKDHIEEIGLLKFDFLGLRTLTVLRDSRDLIDAKEGRWIDYDVLPMDDPAPYELISRGETIGVFQLESQGMMAFMKELKPRNLEDVIAGISLYRPGPMEQIPRFLKGREESSAVEYEHPKLKPILEVTHGSIVYQEQVMQIVRDLAGFSLGQADLVRRAMAKKKPDELARYEELFLFGGKDAKGNDIDGCVKRGVSEAIGRQIFSEVMAFAGYAFNKAHAAAYAVLAYQTAWLKHYYPVEFMAAMLNSFLGNLSKAGVYLAEADRLGIPVLGPNVNHSGVRFTTEDGGIRFALAAVKNVGEGQAQKLVDEREANGPFQSYGDFLRRCHEAGIGKKVIESLILASALDDFPEHRSQMLASMAPYLEILETKTEQMEGQISLFDLAPVADKPQVKEPELVDVPRYSRRQDLAAEKEMLGVYVTGHPLDDYRERLEDPRILSSLEFTSVEEGSIDAPIDEAMAGDVGSSYRSARVQSGAEVVMGGLLNLKRNRQTKRQELMAILEMEDLEGRYDAVVFPNVLREYTESLHEDGVYLLRGRVSIRDEFPPSLLVNEVLELSAPEPVSDAVVDAFFRGLEEAGAEARSGGTEGGSGAGSGNDGGYPDPGMLTEFEPPQAWAESSSYSASGDDKQGSGSGSAGGVEFPPLPEEEGYAHAYEPQWDARYGEGRGAGGMNSGYEPTGEYPGTHAEPHPMLFLHFGAGTPEKKRRRIKALLNYFAGPTPIRVYDSEAGRFDRAGLPAGVELTPFVLERLMRWLGPDNVYIQKF